jgi:hypothetical protein
LASSFSSSRCLRFLPAFLTMDSLLTLDIYRAKKKNGQD